MLIKIDPFVEKLSRLNQLKPAVVEESASYGEVLGLMRASQVGSVLVCRKGELRGIFTERDVLNKCLLERASDKTPIAKLMTPNPVTVGVESTVGQAISAMHKSRVRNLPVVDDKGRPVGLLTVGRLIRYLAENFPAEVVNLPPKPSQVSEEVEGA